MTAKKTAVVLFQLGGPDSLEAVEPFLFNLFMDRDIIDFPGSSFLQKPLAKFISKRRSKKSAEHYRLIGGKSPILELTQRQASAVELLFREQDKDIDVFTAMRYCSPSIETVVKKVKQGKYDRIILLPLYPHFSKTTTLSSLNEWKRQTERMESAIPSRLICCYPDHPLLIKAFAENINSAISRFRNISSEEIDLVFSAHGIPVKYIDQGDPYQMQVEETVKSIVKLGGWNSPHTLCYQSKIGPMKWLRPPLLETVKNLADKGRKGLLIIPVSFVTDNIETMYEINIEVRNYAADCGIKQFEIMPALNNHPKFIQCLTELVLDRIDSDEQPETCRRIQSSQKNSSKHSLCPMQF